MRLYLSWIEGLTTNQNVTGSNPVSRTTQQQPGDACRLRALCFLGGGRDGVLGLSARGGLERADALGTNNVQRLTQLPSEHSDSLGGRVGLVTHRPQPIPEAT